MDIEGSKITDSKKKCFQMFPDVLLEAFLKRLAGWPAWFSLETSSPRSERDHAPVAVTTGLGILRLASGSPDMLRVASHVGLLGQGEEYSVHDQLEFHHQADEGVDLLG